MKKTIVATITLLAIATPVFGQEMSKYTAMSGAIDVWASSFCNAARLGANKKEATDGAFDDFFLYLSGLIGEEKAIEVFQSVGSKRFAANVFEIVMKQCPSEFMTLYDGNIPSP
ncbi:MAG: hypothetical protein VKL20_08855 [Synechocystis sp.]|nr:hypothetical protein [Synechocystis sp.]